MLKAGLELLTELLTVVIAGIVGVLILKWIDGPAPAAAAAH